MSDLVLDLPLRPLLELVEVREENGGQAAAPAISCSFDSRSIATLVGLSGAGREVLGRLITGQTLPASGVIRFSGRRIERLGPAVRLALGIASTKRRQPFYPGSLTALLADARAVVVPAGWRQTLAIGSAPSSASAEDIADILAFLEIEHLAQRPVASLGGLDARLADLARCLAQRPRLILLEHPLAGLAADDKAVVVACLERLRGAELALIVIDDDLATLSGLADRCVVLHHGRLIADAAPDAIGGMPHVFRAITGSEL